MKKLLLATAMVAFMFAEQANAQIKTPQPSPESTVMQKVGLADVSVTYSRPSMKGRAIFGDLVPFDKMWRTGANASTDIEFTEAVEFGGTKVEAGKYALYSVPGKKEWQVMLYSEADHWGTPRDFDESKVVATATVPVYEMPMDIETFEIGFQNITNSSADVYLIWENSFVAVPISVDTQTAVQASIDKVMGGPSANDYYAAANFYFDEGIDMEKAQTWAAKAVEMRPEAFWMSRKLAEIQAENGDLKAAIKTAKMSMEAAEKAGNGQYVKFNEANIAKWKKMK